ncbi:MAG: hypothetical protein AMS18_01925 [Gemmatimonas sp. SG8_17]|nr:MAG: hypothetical protein AMS18_01925 [Gemmatimonas sp. SG8_17]
MHTVSLTGGGKWSFCQSVLAVAALVGVYGTPLHSQTIRGRVVDSVTAAPLKGLDVVLLNSDRDTVATTRSGSDGGFVLVAEAGSYTLRIRCMGHQPREVTIQLPTDSAVTIRLVPVAIRPRELAGASGMPLQRIHRGGGQMGWWIHCVGKPRVAG